MAAATTSAWAAAAAHDALPRLHLVSFMNQVRNEVAVLQVSAEAQGLYPAFIGAGRAAWWPDGLGVKINALRAFLQGPRVLDADVVVFADAFDVMLFAGEDEIIGAFLEMERATGRSLVFDAEPSCWPSYTQHCTQAGLQSGMHGRRFLNSGLIVGRGRAFRRMLAEPVPDVIEGSDQRWYHEYYVTNHHDITLDVNCTLACSVVELSDGDGEWLSGSRRLAVGPNRPPLVHFNGPAHWPVWRGGVATSRMADVFRAAYPQEAALALDSWSVGARVGSVRAELYSGAGLWDAWAGALVRGGHCLQCSALRSGHHVCQSLTPMGEDCRPATSSAVALLAVLLTVFGRCCMQRRRQPPARKGRG